ncbi:MAG TPA: DUF2269 family protein [Solirubrobacterales bacterium]|jgi:hypothetical protein|nr:DUF2269 family protein [Solirubrobacterales bacterium]
MVAATVTFYSVVVFFHIAAVVIGFGPTFAYGAYMATAQREGGQAIPLIGRTIVFWDRTVNTAAMTLILLTGIYLASDGPYGTGSFFISWGFVAIVILFALTHAFFIPRTRRAVELAERDLAAPDGKLSTEFEALSGQLAKVGIAAGLLVILTIYVMTAKPFL